MDGIAAPVVARDNWSLHAAAPLRRTLITLRRALAGRLTLSRLLFSLLLDFMPPRSSVPSAFMSLPLRLAASFQRPSISLGLRGLHVGLAAAVMAAIALHCAR
jgi:hypothetical protein